jgi:hypothetical protein
MARSLAFLIACAGLAPLGAGAQACASSLLEARDWLASPSAEPAWRETSMADGKPLSLRLDERQGSLFVRFVKADEGLWAEGSARLCRAGREVQVHLAASDLTFGPAAGWFLRHVLGHGATFRLTPLEGGRLRIVTRGWSGEFAALPDNR